MSRTMPCAADEPEYTKVSKRDYEEAITLDHLNDGLACISDAWWNLHEACKLEVYFEEDERDVEQMRDNLQKMEKQLRKILERRGVL